MIVNNSSFDKPGRRTLNPLSTGEPVRSDGNRFAAIDGDEVAVVRGVAEEEVENENEKKDEPVTWRSLPHRRQLVILTLARLSEPVVQTSLQVRSSSQEKSPLKSP